MYHWKKSALAMALALSVISGSGLSAAADPAAGSQTEAGLTGTHPVQMPQGQAAIRLKKGRAYLYDGGGQRVRGMKGVREYPAGSGTFYYFLTKSGRVHRGGFLNKKGKTYYADQNGQLAMGWKKIGRRWYHFHTRRAYARTGVIKDAASGKKFYLNKKGIRKTGLIRYKKHLYYFDKKNGIQADGAFLGGAATTGFRKIKGKTYYFNSKGRAVVGWLNLDGEKYYFNGQGVMQTERMVVGSKVYTFDKKTGAATGSRRATGPYSIRVNQTTCVVTIYRGNVPVKAMRCSVGLNNATPDGTFSLSRKIHWQPLFGNCYGQYTSTITGNILFHSVFYYRYRDDHSLATDAYRLLGQPASHGCVRLTAGDAYYIYHNCPNGTRVTIFHGSSKDDPLGKPAHPYPNWTGNYDPTDPIPGD